MFFCIQTRYTKGTSNLQGEVSWLLVWSPNQLGGLVINGRLVSGFSIIN